MGGEIWVLRVRVTLVWFFHLLEMTFWLVLQKMMLHHVLGSAYRCEQGNARSSWRINNTGSSKKSDEGRISGSIANGADN